MPWKPEAPKFYNPRIDVVSTFMNIPPLEDPLLKMLVGMLTIHGKSNRARGTAARVLHHLHALTRAPPLPVFREGLFAIAPLAKSKKWNTSALKHFMKPAPLTERRSMFHAMKWLLDECGNPGPLPLEERIAREIMDIHNGKSTLLNKRLEWHKEAMISKANVNTRPQTSRRSR
ncbi:ribosomal protein S7 [Cylindrobasidium torrendii FP15055 ss-10]|uniref:Ribosomal protein S7 n=1 Tax=Cylindrobasidium torrendii FP15055 ss-10 TaxID=1314674 RepID=A0A0D7BQ42_9AGAR|nr:ribosomal protein S7 [Cylindrobasidium torrendii FP15055 ss-10]